MALAMMVPAKGKASTDVSQTPDKTEAGDNLASKSAPPELTGRWDFSRLLTIEAEPEVVGDAKESVQKVQDIAQDAWRMTLKAAARDNEAAVVASAASKNTVTEVNSAATGASEVLPKSAVTSEVQGTPGSSTTFSPKPMTFEEVRLWLQSFNAGPYACLKYKGNVPYEETKNYIPRVMKYYEEVGETEYDAEIEAAAAKYGLDPQMIRAIIMTESSFNNETVSHAGARGLMQVMPVVWKDIKDKYDLDWEYSTGVFEPEKNIEVACAYLAWLRYDFLPRHFDAYESDPQAPVVLVRDKDRGVPDRESPRIIVKAIDSASSPAPTEIVSAVDVEPKTVIADSSAASSKSKGSKAKAKSDSDDAGDKSEKSEPKAAKSKIEISDAGESKSAKKSSGGKSRVVVHGGKGKAVSISVGGDGKVAAQRDSDKQDSDEISKQKRNAVAKADNKEDDKQGG